MLGSDGSINLADGVLMGSARRSAKESGRTSADRGAGGVVRRVDELGRIVIPVEIRKRFGIAVRDPLEIGVRGDTIVLSKPQDTCVFCGSREQLEEFRGRQVCVNCRLELASDVVSAESR
jgi:AbrB family transcriptional regulator, transcriptional pleiotropic regulator of transition state genes